MSQTDKALKPSHKEQMARLEAEVQGLREQLRRSQRMATVGTMAAMVAHEFNNILTPIVNYAQMAQTNPTLQPKALAKAADGGQRAAKICNAILKLTHNDAAASEVMVVDVVNESLSAMARDPGKDGIELVLDIPENLSLSTRPVELQQVLVNLISNARQAVMARGGSAKRIEISASRHKGSVTISVADSGSGIAPENLQKVFEAFYTTREGSADCGHGLGLCVCREIITQLGGTINVESVPGSGARFTLRLPA